MENCGLHSMQDIIIFLITNLLFGFVAKALASIGLGAIANSFDVFCLLGNFLC
jgi:hypothetical protein